MKFRIKEALENKGFIHAKDPFGISAPSNYLYKKMEKEVEVAFYGMYLTTFEITVRISEDESSLFVSYSKGGYEPFKTKAHSADKRAYNAIIETAANNGFAI